MRSMPVADSQIWRLRRLQEGPHGELAQVGRRVDQRRPALARGEQHCSSQVGWISAQRRAPAEQVRQLVGVHPSILALLLCLRLVSVAGRRSRTPKLRSRQIAPRSGLAARASRAGNPPSSSLFANGKACSLIAPPIVGRAIADARSMQCRSSRESAGVSRGSLRWRLATPRERLRRRRGQRPGPRRGARDP